MQRRKYSLFIPSIRNSFEHYVYSFTEYDLYIMQDMYPLLLGMLFWVSVHVAAVYFWSC